METTTCTILEAIEQVHQASKDSKLKMKHYENLQKEIVMISEYFKTNEIESVLAASFIVLGCIESTKLYFLMRHLNLEYYEFIKYMSHLELLVKKELLIEVKLRDTVEYIVPKHIIRFISDNKTIPDELLLVKERENTFEGFLSEFDKLSEQKDNKEIEYSYFIYQFKNLLQENKHFKLVNFALKSKLELLDCFVFFDVIIDGMSRGENNFQSSLQSTVDDFTFYKRDTSRYISQFLEGKTKLNELNLIEKGNALFAGSHKIQLTKKALDLIYNFEGIKIGYKVNKNDKLIDTEKIQKRQLFYNPAEQQQLESVSRSMSEVAFIKLQKKLKINNMTSGITILLHGKPGTGKTETVYQLAKKYNRPIYKVDISDNKSMWFGESQKLVKKIFTDYQDFKDESEVCPILLLNEADAIIGKRKDAGSSSVADTENAIQNIFLEEMEHFEGILFATTNLIQNLDAAFERRFLFKIGFEKPNLENASKIWKTKLRKITPEEALLLAQRFPFSGGEMENIARKCVMEEVVLGKKINFEKIMAFCENESWGPKNKGSRIGF
ncbi:ATP-binding protein [Flavobacterium luteum]|uniref:ATP-binding protein n=1 Tax=Flavobacterium luteum TaxID=2026654 RepID=A0A7J5AFR9_9FLAO|nr:ATP-binding protein [Flavobacterium luteum]KAB1156323.1 ATP-binding protein [Flavobacterium luteum]